ncbi:MAG TPA: LuxR C-terminal-related transcriptional regulator [Pseudonocardiaceae bacterium]|nr:LuxR C-terminal-related transcriptional regulator [Pseudonocardiaceae bacterium]
MTGAGARVAEPVGNTPARRLLADVSGDPRAHLVAGVTGPAGTGKSGLLDTLAQTYRGAGVTVCRGLPAAENAVLLVDDGQALGAEQLAELTGFAARDGARVVVAYRPWPARDALAELPRTRPQIRLGHLDRAELTARIGAARGGAPATELVDRIRAHTGGLPRLVELALAAPGGGRAAELDWVLAAVDRLPARARDLLIALTLGAESDVDGLAQLLSLPAKEIADTLECAWSAGLLDGGGRVIGLAAEAVACTVGAIAQREIRRRIAEVQLDRGGPLLPTAKLLLAVGARGPRAAAALEAAGDEALADSAEAAGQLFDAAIAAGAAPGRLAARRAEAAALRGDLDTALRLADRALADGPVGDRDRAAGVAASVLAHRGMLAEGAALCRGSGPGTGAAVTALIGIGDLPAANRELAALEQPGRRGGLAQAVGALVARGLHHTIIGRGLVGLSELMQAARLPGARAHRLLLPEPPAALAALVAIHLGEPDVAARTVGRALAERPAGADAVRCRLLRGWIALLRGELATVATTLAELADPLEPRDELYAAALAVGLARRRTDLAGLLAAWPRAREAVLAHPVDLYMLQPLGEIAVAAAKLREDHLLAEHLYQAETMLDRLGRPALWTGTLHWYGLHAAIAAESPKTAVRHVRSMNLLAPGGRSAAALARASGTWLRVLGGEVDVAAVTGAARDIQAVGLVWDGARLAAQAAIRTDDRKAMASLLSFARALHDGAARGAAARAAEPGDTVALSNRELEVAALLVQGMTYKQIGERLFISAKTVEHHIARIRRRMGDPGRRELLARLKAQLNSEVTEQ